MLNHARMLSVWAKLPRPAPTAPPLVYHPVPCHLIDVAAVARRLWCECVAPAGRQQFADAVGLTPEAAEAWVAFLAGAHDVGKAAPTFQFRDVWYGAHTVEAGLPKPRVTPPGGVAHGLISARALRDYLDPRLAKSVLRDLAAAVGGHHGIVPTSGQVLYDVPESALGGDAWTECRKDLLDWLAASTSLPEAGPTALPHAAGMFLAGLISVADWIGSDSSIFPYAWDETAGPPSLDLAAYRQVASERAAAAIQRLGWSPARQAPHRPTFDALFEQSPRPSQQAVIELASKLDRPALVILEAPMGEGKTEAALYLAEHFAHNLGRPGTYVAMPTQATSNQMFGRVAAMLRRAYPGETVQLQLLHGHASLSADLAQLRQAADRLLHPTGVGVDQQDSGTASVVASEWFTFRKRGLLAPFGVGTVDQALLAALASKHVFVRLFGLAAKPIIIDEVHAYDTYMTALIERLLEWLAALGSPVVLLSATLPTARRTELIQAYARGRGASQPTPRTAAYPCITWTDGNTSDAATVAVSDAAYKTVQLEWVALHVEKRTADLGDLGDRLAEAIADGGCVAVVCNTVARAQALYAALRARFPGLADDGLPVVDLLHSRFCVKDRDRRERRSLVRFGKPDGTVGSGRAAQAVRRPDRAILVATQIIEQSLDLDFDLMISDLAPADLVLQRLGRLHRHSRRTGQRPPRLAEPTLWLVRPGQHPSGVPEFDRGSSAIYSRHVLLRSWLALRDRPTLAVPADVADLVEAVYDPARACPQTEPDAVRELWKTSQDADIKDYEKEEQEAGKRMLKIPYLEDQLANLVDTPRDEDNADLHREFQALTRLTEPSVAVVMLYGDRQRTWLDAGRRPLDLQREPAKGTVAALLRRTITVSDRSIIGELFAQKVPAAWQRSALLRQHRVLLLDPATHAVQVGGRRVTLDPDLGLVVD